MRYLPRVIVVSLFLAVVAASWDVWWHGVVGRESFWIPPHILLYLSVMTALIAGGYGWWRGEQEWRPLALALLLIPLSAPFDELWHRIFGVENVASIEIIWSPPHVVLALALVGSFWYLLRFLRREPDPSLREFLLTLAYAGMFGPLGFLLSPFEPTGPHHILGFWGVVPLAALFIFILLASAGEERITAGGTKTALLVVFISTISQHSGKLALGVAVAPHDHPPLWLAMFATLAAAIAVDLSSRLPYWARGVLAGALWAGILYGFSTSFFAPQFQYGSGEIAIAVMSGVLGGLLASSLSQQTQSGLFKSV